MACLADRSPRPAARPVRFVGPTNGRLPFVARDEHGAALVEFAMVGSLLMMMVLGVIEYGSLFSSSHTLTSLSREGANLAARGATLQQAVATVMANGADIQLTSRGGAIASRVAVRDGVAEVEEQFATAGYEGRSTLGAAGATAAGVDAWGLAEDQLVYVVEIFYSYDPVTPFPQVVDVGIPEELYERGIF